MARSYAFVIAAAITLCGCHNKNDSFPETSAEAEPLRWLDHADVVADFTDHVEHQHDTRFISLPANATSGAFGLGDTPEVKQLVQRHGERKIEGATTVITSREQERLLHKAHNYARQYNALLLHYLREHP